MKYNFVKMLFVLILPLCAHQQERPIFSRAQIEEFSYHIQDIILHPKHTMGLEIKKSSAGIKIGVAIAAGIYLCFTDLSALSSVGLLGVLLPEYYHQKVQEVNKLELNLRIIKAQLGNKKDRWSTFARSPASITQWNDSMNSDLQWIKTNKDFLENLEPICDTLGN